MSPLRKICIALLSILAFSSFANANLLNFSSFESNHNGSYAGPYVSTGFPVVVGSSVWDSEVVGQWVASSAHAGWITSDGDGGTAINLRKAANNYSQAYDCSQLPGNMPLELSCRYRFLEGASDAATLYVRVVALKKAAAGQEDTVATGGNSSSVSSMITGELGNYVSLGALVVPVDGAPRDTWCNVSTTVLYPGDWDYLYVKFCYIGAPNAGYYQIDDVELNEPSLVANAGSDISVIDTDDNGSETIMLDGSLSASLTSTITSYSWSEGGSVIATGATPSVDFAVGEHLVTLTVTDAEGTSVSDDVNVEIIYGGPRPPVADAGGDIIRASDTNGDGFEQVTLDGSASSDPDSQIVSYIWREGSSILAMGANPTVTLAVGVHDITLTVTDDTDLSDTDTITVNVREVPALIGNEISEFKSGISLDVLGAYGLDYLVENWYHESAVDPRCTIYINSYVPLALRHNEMNRRHSDIVGTSGGGIIRYRPDMDMSAGWAFTEGDGTPYAQWVDGTSFDDMFYPDGALVLDATGPLPGGDISDPPTFYWRGINDINGDQWHTLSVWDDDYDSSVYYDDWCSDGKMYYFVVNPATPCISFSTNDDLSQWYTRPIKAYFMPKLVEQISFLLGDVDIELAALEAMPVMYSLRVEGDSADVWQDYTAPLNTISLGLASDTSYELRYRIGTDGVVKTRVIHYDPAYPSDAEQHPQNILWVGEAGLDRIRDRVLGGDPARAIYANSYNAIKTNSWFHRRGRDTYMDGDRTNTFSSAALNNAFPLVMEGFDSYPEMMAFLHDGMLDNILNLDPIGREGNHNRALPCKELNYQGYYSVKTPMLMAIAYDWIITEMRRENYATGFTAIEDYKMRDMLGHFAMNSVCRLTGTYTGFTDENGYDLGMWSTAWIVGGNIIAAVMPEYNTELFGSSGAPTGNSGPAAAWTPFPDHPATWWDAITDRNMPLYDHPNQTQRSGYWGLINEVPEWYDRPAYFGTHLMGGMYFMLVNFRANYDGYHFDHIDEALSLAADGILPALKNPSEGPAKNLSVVMINHNFPELAAQTEALLTAGVPYGEQNISESFSTHNVTAMCLYEDDWQQLLELPGDANADGVVDLDDFIILKQNYGSQGADVSQGDFNGDGNVDLDDFIILKQNYGKTL